MFSLSSFSSFWVIHTLWESKTAMLTMFGLSFILITVWQLHKNRCMELGYLILGGTKKNKEISYTIAFFENMLNRVKQYNTSYFLWLMRVFSLPKSLLDIHHSVHWTGRVSGYCNICQLLLLSISCFGTFLFSEGGISPCRRS